MCQNVFFYPVKDPLRSYFTWCRAEDDRAQWESLKFAGKHTIQGKTSTRRSLSLSPRCTLLCEPPSEQRALCFAETILRLSRNRWDILYDIMYLFHALECKKGLPLANACAIKFWQLKLSEIKYGWNMVQSLLLWLQERRVKLQKILERNRIVHPLL